MIVDSINGTVDTKEVESKIMAARGVNSTNQEMVDIKFQDGSIISVPVKTFITADGGICKSISKIIPVGEEMLLAEYGSVDLITILQMAGGTSTPVNVFANVCIVGTGDKVNPTYKLGMGFIPRMMGEPAIRNTYDKDNEMSYDRLVLKAKEDKELFAAVTIANNKERTKVGLKISDTALSVDTINKMNQLKDQKISSAMLYKGDKVRFLNYKLMHQGNIAAIIEP